eukprot:GHVO01053691.1.p1 GENE.GHVO01053691.1~~GHVO01053691.1.p1  ORF type:complete len:184 (+),score=2.04 GHVO01053691.1:114-665(+)
MQLKACKAQKMGDSGRLKPPRRFMYWRYFLFVFCATAEMWADSCGFPLLLSNVVTPISFAIRCSSVMFERSSSLEELDEVEALRLGLALVTLLWAGLESLLFSFRLDAAAIVSYQGLEPSSYGLSRRRDRSYSSYLEYRRRGLSFLLGDLDRLWPLPRSCLMRRDRGRLPLLSRLGLRLRTAR